MSEPSIRLPPEIWLRISSLLPKNDVLHLSETTTYFHYMIRPLLYHKVTLKKAPQILSTLSLLGRDKELARMVSELTLDTGNFLGSQQECLMDLNAMKHMTGLKRLALWGNICSLRDGGESMEKVFEVLHELRDLRELSIDASWNSFPEDHLSKIQHLEVVRWACIGPRSDILLHSLLSASCDSLRTLHISVLILSEEKQKLFFSLRFPCLESLTLRDVSENDPLGEPFVNFLITHDSLTHLDLGHSMVCPSELQFTDSMVETFRANPSTILPRLKSFCGGAISAGIMARAGLTCLSTTLVKLDVGPSGYDCPQDEMLRQVLNISGLSDPTQLGRTPGRFCMLKDIGLELGDFVGSGVPMLIFVLLATFITCAPAEHSVPYPHSPIEVWSRPFPFVNSPEEARTAEAVAKTFRMMKNLRILHLDWRFVGEEDYDSKAWMEQFVSSCGEKIERVVFCRPSGNVVESWGVERGRMGKDGSAETKTRTWLESNDEN